MTLHHGRRVTYKFVLAERISTALPRDSSPTQSWYTLAVYNPTDEEPCRHSGVEVRRSHTFKGLISQLKEQGVVIESGDLIETIPASFGYFMTEGYNNPVDARTLLEFDRTVHAEQGSHQPR
jgi:hypothetical protein